MRLDFDSTKAWSQGPYRRIKEITDCDSQANLAEYLNCRQSSISDAKKRLRIPADWLLKLWEKTGANPHWILTGKGPQFLVPAESVAGLPGQEAGPEMVDVMKCYACPLEEKLLELQTVTNDALKLKRHLGTIHGPHLLWKE